MQIYVDVLCYWICMNVLLCNINNSQSLPYKIRVFFSEIYKTFVHHLSNICQICKAFVKYVNYWMHEDSFQNGMHIICILSCFLNIGRSKILDLKEAQIGLIFLHKWNGMDWRRKMWHRNSWFVILEYIANIHNLYVLLYFIFIVFQSLDIELLHQKCFFFILYCRVKFQMMIMFNENYDYDNDKSNIDENYDGNDIQIL